MKSSKDEQSRNKGDNFQKTEVMSYLEEYPHLSKFLIIDSSGISHNRKPYPSYKDSIHRKNLKKLKNLNENKNSFCIQSDLPLITKPRYMQHHILFAYHKIQFLLYKNEYYQQKIEINFQKYVSLLIILFNLIIADTTNQSIVIDVEFDKLNAFLQKVPDKIKRIRSHYLQAIQDISKEIKKSTKNASELRKDFVEILFKTKSMIDPALNFFCPTYLQEEFEYIIFSPNFGVSDLLHQIIDKDGFNKQTPSELVQNIIKLNYQIIQVHKLKKEDNTSLIITFLFRIIFNEVYPMIKLFFLPEFNFDLLLKLKDMTLNEIGVPLEFCPSEFSSEKLMNDIPRNTFRNDPNYSLASLHIEFISFFTNPLDILHQISASLHEIEKAAMIYKVKNDLHDDDKNSDSAIDADFKEKCEKDGLTDFLFPFEVTFSLFISTILASDVPEFMRIAAFTDQYSPSFGLCASFEFALAKLKTVSIYMQNVAQEMIEKEAKMKKDDTKSDKKMKVTEDEK